MGGEFFEDLLLFTDIFFVPFLRHRSPLGSMRSKCFFRKSRRLQYCSIELFKNLSF
jgi:hypothetical protein